MADSSRTGGFSRAARMNRLLKEWVHDTYKSKHKLPEPTVCRQCGAVYRKGSWRWEDAPVGAHEDTCAACLRIEDNVPAGYLTLEGSFLVEHREEVMHLVRNIEAKEKKEHPLKRIMAVDEKPDGLVVTVTDPHLARGIGEALHQAYKGELDFSYQEEENLLRVFWRR